MSGTLILILYHRTFLICNEWTIFAILTGTISRQELGILLNAMGLPGINREKFNLIDVDRSGELSLDELMTYLNSVS